MGTDRQTELRDIMNTLQQVIGHRSVPWHPVIHLGEVPGADVQLKIVDAVLRLRPGERAGLADVWEVFAVPLDQEEAIGKFQPAWWKDDSPSLFITGMSLMT